MHSTVSAAILTARAVCSQLQARGCGVPLKLRGKYFGAQGPSHLIWKSMNCSAHWMWQTTLEVFKLSEKVVEYT